jgi:Holliday junction resolvase RusA-like endonuclease
VRLTFFVPGIPVPQGSKTAYVSKSTGRPIVVDKDVRLPQWRMKITAYALDAKANSAMRLPIDGAVGSQITFFMPRPKSHYGSGKNATTLKPSAPLWPATMPDIDKLLRAVFDALTDAQVWHDDGQVVFVTMTERYENAAGPGVEITVGPMTSPIRSNP